MLLVSVISTTSLTEDEICWLQSNQSATSISRKEWVELANFFSAGNYILNIRTSLYIHFSRAVSFASSGLMKRVSTPGATELTPSHQLEPHPYGPWLRCWRGVTGSEVPVPSQEENGVITTGTLNFWSLDCLYNFIFLVLGASFQRSKPRSTSTFSRE